MFKKYFQNKEVKRENVLWKQEKQSRQILADVSRFSDFMGIYESIQCEGRSTNHPIGQW